jgi:hypothetical protein
MHAMSPMPGHEHERPGPQRAPRGGGLALLAAFALSGAAAPAGAQAAAVAPLHFVEGVARAPADGRLLYRELHWTRHEGARLVERLVLYRCAAGNAFARKHLDYRGSAIAPAFTLEDARTGYREGLRRGAGAALFVRRGMGEPERSAPLRAADAVVDAGFDEFVRARWDALAAGRAVPIEFALPARLRSYRFDLSRVGAERIAGEPAWRFRLRLKGVLGWVAPEVDVAYSQRTRRLLRFEGLSNLRAPGGKAQWLARIDFPAATTPAPDAAWRAAAAEPLSACATGQRADASGPGADTRTHIASR